MTISEFSGLYKGRPEGYIRRFVCRDMHMWEKLGLYDRLAEYMKSRKKTKDELVGQVFLRAFGDIRKDWYPRLSASEFFEGFCGWKWGGAGLYVKKFSLINDAYRYRYGDTTKPSVSEFSVYAAAMDVFIDGEHAEIPVYGGYEVDSNCVEVPDAVPDIMLVCRDGCYPVLAGFYIGGKCRRLDTGRAVWLGCYEQDTVDYCTGKMEMEHAKNYAEKQSRLSYEKKLEQMRIDKYERERNNCDWDMDWEAETLDALGYDTDEYIEDRDWWMF